MEQSYRTLRGNMFRSGPTPSAGGPGKRAEFMMSEMKQGMDTITKIEDSAPMLAALG